MTLDTQAATREANARGEGFKADGGKPDWTLFPFDGAEVVVRVLERGAQKYARDNWRKVPGALQRYRAAALRHLAADALGEDNDPETGLPHLAHAACCTLFVLALRRGDPRPSYDEIATALRDERYTREALDKRVAELKARVAELESLLGPRRVA